MLDRFARLANMASLPIMGKLTSTEFGAVV